MRKPITTVILAALVGSGALLATTDSLDAAPGAADDMLLFSAYPFDTQRDQLVAPAPFAVQSHMAGLQIVQFDGPVRPEWLQALKARAIVPVHYVANNGYIVWADEAGLERLANLRQRNAWLQYAGPFQAFLKVDPRLGERLGQGAQDDAEVDLVVQIYRHAGDSATRRFIADRALMPQNQQAPLGTGKLSLDWSPILSFANVQIRARLADVAAIAERPDVTFVGLRGERRQMDEKQDLILIGDLVPGPGSVSYLQYLTDLGFSQDANDYPIVDVTDSPIHEGGTGATAVNTADEMLHVGGQIGNPSRVAYFNNCSSLPDTSVGAEDGHGALNAGIVAGWDQTAGAPYEDADGHQLGLGVNPFGRVASTAIFVPGYNVAGCGNNDTGVIKSVWQSGGRINTNSWGLTFPPSTYDDGDQAYDAGTRDADPDAAGNQELIVLFSASNAGPGAATVSSPAAGKNVITVGASENLRPQWTDGCGTGPSGADDSMDVIGFSGRGPAPGNRAKPEVIAPGTHIQARASIYSGYVGGGVCDTYYPPAQTVFASSSGTSHSTPAVAGVTSLAYWWIEQGGSGAAAGTIDEIDGSRAPSPALSKAWLMAHPTYLTGVGANDDLPSNSQGYGMPNLDIMFDATPKVLLDQSELFVASGESREFTWGVADPTKPVRIALAWTDAPGALGTSPQVNNLDLTVVAGGQTYLGNEFDQQWSVTGGSADTQNNYEAVFLPAGAASDLAITIDATNIAGDGVPANGTPTDQDFAIVCYNCARAPTFTLSAPETEANVCSGTDFDMTINVGAIQGFADPVDLAVSGTPAGATGAVDPSTVTTLPGSAVLSITDSAGVAAGDYVVTLAATSGAISKTLDFDLTYSTFAPPVPVLDAPADGEANVELSPVLTWEAAEQAVTYLVEIADDPDFTTVIASTETADTAWTVSPPLEPSHRYYWRVTARNACGASVAGPTADTVFLDGFDGPLPIASNMFTTLPLPGSCPLDTTEVVVFEDDLEAGAGSWTHGANAGTDSWTLGSTANSGTQAWQANNFAGVNDQWLVSPEMVLPSDLSNLTLRFWNQQSMESSAGGCFDGAILEVSSDGGATWTQVTTGLLTDPYDGPVSTTYSNPLGGRDAWCGDPEAYLRSVVDLAPYAGQTVSFRFRMGNDVSVTSANPGWAIDDVKVAGCEID